MNRYIYPLKEGVDYRTPSKRAELAGAWVEVNVITGEHYKSIRLLDFYIDSCDKFVDKFESKLWMAFLWGSCYTLTTPLAVLYYFPEPPSTPEEFKRFSDWYNTTFHKQKFDTDCRYRKSVFLRCLASYMEKLGGRTQQEVILPLLKRKKNFDNMWQFADSIKYFGRLSNWNYLEAVNYVTRNLFRLDAPSFMLTLVSESESNRNGVCYLLNREDLNTKHGIKADGNRITQEECLLLERGVEKFLRKFKKQFSDLGVVNRLNLETTICCWFKKMFRVGNTRYLGSDAEKTFAELKKFEENWPDVDTSLIYRAREHFLPEHLRCECQPADERGVKKWKFEVFQKTGAPLSIIRFQNNEVWKNER